MYQIVYFYGSLGEIEEIGLEDTESYGPIFVSNLVDEGHLYAINSSLGSHRMEEEDIEGLLAEIEDGEILSVFFPNRGLLKKALKATLTYSGIKDSSDVEVVRA